MSDDTVDIYEFTLPEPYAEATPQDYADALRDHADRRIGGPLIDFVMVAAAELIESQAATIERLQQEAAAR